jgi:hypothetical protein
MHRRFARARIARVVMLLSFAAGIAHAQFKAEVDPDWRESDAPPPPSLKTDGLIPLDIQGSSLRYGVDPSSVKVGADGIVRYVVVATSSSGTVNGIYEGIHCKTGEFKVYARYNPASGWVAASDPLWRSMQQTSQSRHSLMIARNGVCVGHGINGTAQQIVRDLRAPNDTRFNQPQ